MDAPDPSPSHPLPRNVKLLGWASLLNDVASEMIFPLMPQFLLTLLGGSKFHLGIIEGAADTAASLLKLWSGAWSDRLRARKGLVVFGYALAALSRPFAGIVVAPWQLFAVRIADRTGKGVRGAPRDAMIAESTAPEARGRAFGFNRGMDHLGAAIGPLLATAFLLAWPGALRPLFLLTIVPGVTVVGLLLIGLREPSPTTRAAKPFSLTLTPFDRRFRQYLLALVVFTLGNSSDAFLLVRAGELGVGVAWLPVLWCAFHIVKSSGSVIAGRWVDRYGSRPLIVAGWLVYAGVYVAFGAATAAWHVWALFLLYGAFHALTEPAERAMVANLVGAENRGLAYGWYNFAIGIVTLPASVAFGWLYERWGAMAAFGWGATLSLLACVMLIGITTIPRPAAAHDAHR